MEWFCASNTCLRQRWVRHRYTKALTEELLTLIQYKSPCIEMIRPRVEACPEAVQTRDLFDNLPIHTACSNGAPLDVIQCLVEAWPSSLQTVGSEQDTPLSLACIVSANDLSVIQYLGDQCRAAFLQPNKRHKRPLHLVCARSPSVDVVRYMVTTEPRALTTRDKTREVPLHVACSHKASLPVIQILVQANPSTVHSRNIRGDLPLHLACGTRAPLSVIELLVQAGQSTGTSTGLFTSSSSSSSPPSLLQVANYRGECPLHTAVSLANASEEMVAYLIRQCPAVLERKTTSLQQLPIHVACAAGVGPTVMQLLIDHAPHTLAVQDKNGNLPLHVACLEHNNHSAVTLESIRVLFYALPEAIRRINDQGNLPLHQACAAENVSLDLIRFLVDRWKSGWQDAKSSQVNDQDNDKNNEGNTQQSLLNVEKYMQGASVTNRNGDTPLHLACSSHAPMEVIRYLIKLWPGALLVQNAEKMTPIQLAQLLRRGISSDECTNYMTEQVSRRLFDLCRFQSKANLASMKQLVQVHPSIVQTPNANGDLPLHVLLKAFHEDTSCPMLEAVQLLVEACREVMTYSDAHGDFPLHLACRNLKPAHHAHHHVSREIVLWLQQVGDSIKLVNRQGQIPLHVALRYGHAPRLVQAMIYAWPESVTVPDNEGMLPWQIAVEQQQRQNGKNIVPDSLVRWLQDQTESTITPAHTVSLD